MATTSDILSVHGTVFDDAVSQVRSEDTASVIAEIDSLHEPRPAPRVLGTDHRGEGPICAECWTDWPCATHRAIYGETKENCVHRI